MSEEIHLTPEEPERISKAIGNFLNENKVNLVGNSADLRMDAT